MRTVHAIGVFLCMTVSQLQPALAQARCAPDPTKLGVSRTVVLDAAPGPRFGAQYKEASFLADGEVVLTFDDGPLRTFTKPVLEALAVHCTKATFFMVGRMALFDPPMVKEVARQGHTVATHTWSHANLQRLTPAEAQVEIEMGVSAVRHALGKPISPLFRFPYLRDTEPTLIHLQGRQFAAIGIDVDSRDFETKSAVAVSERVLNELAAKRKGIILLHDIHASTAGALPLLLAELKERGFKVVHLRTKAQAQTVAHYDDLARQEVERMRLVLAKQPLAKRALRFPSTVFSEAHADPAAAKAPPALPRPAPRKDADSDWMTHIWRW